MTVAELREKLSHLGPETQVIFSIINRKTGIGLVADRVKRYDTSLGLIILEGEARD